MPSRVCVTLKWIQITDNMEPGSEALGEFVFTSRVTGSEGTSERRLPPEGSWFISEKPGKNRVKLDEVLYLGDVENDLQIELSGEEQDRITGSDSLPAYERSFSGPPSSWVGLHGPGDEGDEDPESLAGWRIGYEITLV